MAGISVGSVTVDVVPSVRNFARDLRKQVVPQASEIGLEVGKAISAGIRKGLGDPLSGPLDESTRRQQSKAPRQGERVAGAFADAFRRRLRAAFASLPEATIDADSSPADRKIAELRARLEALSNKTVGVDIDAGAALAEVAAIKAELADLGRSKDIQVRVDAAAAESQLAAVQAETSRIDGRTANVRVDADVSGALAGIATVGIALAGLAAIPVGATVGAGILALTPALGAAGAGFAGLGAVAVPALSRIHTALQAQKQATQAATAAGGQARSSATAQAGAQRQLAAAVRNAGYAHTQALDQVRQAEQRYQQALQSEAAAQRAVTQARLSARRAIEDLKNQVIDAGLAVQDAELGVEESRVTWQQMAAAAQVAAGQVASAQAVLAKAQAAQQTVLAGTSVTDAAKKQAQAGVDAAAAALKSAQDQKKAADLAARQADINYRQSVQRLKEQQVQLRRLRADEKAAAKAGVDGSDQVRQARERLAQANQQVTDSELALRRARENVHRVDQQSADQIAAARAAAAQAAQAGAQGAASNTKLAASMAALSPAARKLMRDWLGLKKTFGAWARSLEPDVLPLFSHGIDLIKQALPGLTPVVKGAARAVDGLLTDVGKAAKSPFWTEFRKNLTNLVPTAITGLGHTLGNVITGLAGVVNAFLPYAPAILSWLVRITAQFANWGKNLSGSPKFVQFMDYVRQVAPQVAHTIALVAEAVGHVVVSLAGFGPATLVGLGGLARLISSLSPGQIQAIAIAFLAVRAAIIANSVATKVATGIGTLVLAMQSGGKEGPILARALVLAGRGIGTVAKAAWTGVSALGSLVASYVRTGSAAIAADAASARLGKGLRGVSAAAAGAEAATLSTRGALLGLTSILISVGAVVAVSPLIGKLQDSMLGSAKGTRELSRAMIELGNSGKFTGALVDEFKGKLITARSSVQVFKNDAKELVDPNPIQLFNHAMSQAVAILPGIDSDVGRLRDKFKSLDTTLAQMVQAGQTQQAAAAFSRLRAQLTQAGLKTEQINKLFPQYTAVAQTAVSANDRLTTAINNSNAALEGTYNPSIAAFNAVTRLKQGYDQLITSMRAAHGSFSGNTLASQQLRQAFSGQLDTVVELYQATLKKTGSDNAAKAAVQRQLPILYSLAGRNAEARAQVDALARATGNSTSKQNIAKTSFFNVAHEMGITRGRAEALWKEYAKLPGSTSKAAGGVEHFSQRTHAAIHDLQGKNLNVTVYASGKFRHATTAGLAAGGPVRGPGGPTADKVPIMASAGEHMWTARETSAVGGHAAMHRLRHAALAGQLNGYAVGGAVTLTSRVPSDATVRSVVNSYGYEHMRLTKAGQAAYEEALSLAAVWKKYATRGGSVVAAARTQIGLPYSWGGGGKGGPSYGIGRGARTFGFDCSGLTEFAWWKGRRVSIGGTTGPQHLMSRRISGPAPGALAFPHAGHVMLGSNRPGYVIQAPRTGGFVEEVRRSAPDWRWPKGASTTAGLAAGGPVLPVEAELGRRFSHGLPKRLAFEVKALQIAGDPSGVVPASEWRRYDAGGYLPAGPSLVYNGTGQPEPVLTGRQFDAMHAAGSGGKTVNVMQGATVYVQDPTDVDALAQRTEFAARSATF